MDLWTMLTPSPAGLLVFLAGCLGALAAELMRFYRVRQVVRRPVRWYMAVSISVGEILLAGLYASWILQVSTQHAAFITGLTLPYTLASALGQTVGAARGSR
jgi:hypothetical protein